MLVIPKTPLSVLMTCAIVFKKNSVYRPLASAFVEGI